MANASRRATRRIRDEYTTAPGRRRASSAAETASISYHDGSGAAPGPGQSDRPREKLARAGVEALGDNELLALVLGTGTRFRNAIGVAQEILEAAGGAQGLGRLGLDELSRVSGVAASRAACVMAAVELGRRTLAPVLEERPRIVSSKDAADFLLPRYAGFRVERFGVMLLDQKQRVMRSTILSTGSVDSSLAHPREVFRAAALASASAVIVFHNHPSGDPLPSEADYLVTRRLHEAGQIMGIDLRDHIILGDHRYFSFAEGARP